MARPLTQIEVAEFRERLCEAATRLFSAHGAEGFTMRMLAAEAGCSPMTPYRYFRDKDEILAAVRALAFDRFSDVLEAAAATPGDSRAKATAIGDAYVSFALHNRESYRLMFGMAPAGDERFPDLARARRRSNANMTAYVRAMIDDGVLRGDADLIGQMFWAAIHGVVLLDMTGLLEHGAGADTLRREMMRVMFIGLNTAPPKG
ncbi:MAG: TetR/AcrR family transcriptional regulator [Caulobacteraceae bacterium]|nr:TetR/AcrR family transcriptional regulator [Caulobacteraceae bacterium]